MRVLLCVAALAAVPSLSAQNELGLFTGVGSTNRVTRAFDATEELFTRVDASDFGGLGVDPTNAAVITLTGARAAVYDFDRMTADPFHIVVRTEGTNANLPDVSGAPLTRVGPIQIAPAAGAGGVTFLANFTTPITAPAGQDLFVGCELPPFTNAATNDAVWVFSVNGTGTSGTTYDLPGPGADTSTQFTDTYSHAFVAAGANAGLYNLPRGFFLVEPVLAGAGGVCTAITNQSTMASSNAAPGIGGPLSGLHPDVNGANAGRADDPGYLYIDSAMAGQTVAFFLSGLGLNPNPTPASVFLPGSTGALCVNDLGLDVAATVADANGVASVNAPLDAAARAAIGGAGLQLTWFAIGFDGSTLSASPCGVQTF